MAAEELWQLNARRLARFGYEGEPSRLWDSFHICCKQDLPLDGVPFMVIPRMIARICDLGFIRKRRTPRSSKPSQERDIERSSHLDQHHPASSRFKNRKRIGTDRSSFITVSHVLKGV